MTDYKTRRKWFEEYAGKVEAGLEKPFFQLGYYPCPCCGYPTLDRRGLFYMCFLCWWEDDGQDDHEADEVWGGPNQHYSLSRARDNFSKYLRMFSPGDKLTPREDTVIDKHAKLAIMAAFDNMIGETDNTKIAELWWVVARGRDILERDNWKRRTL